MASGDVSVKEADRRLAAAGTNRPPGGPLILRALPAAACGRDPKLPGFGGRPASSTATTGVSRPPMIVTPAPRPASESGAGPLAVLAAASIPPAVQAFLALCHELDAATERLRRETAQWTGERRAQRRLTIRQTAEHLSEQLEWMQGAEATRRESSPH